MSELGIDESQIEEKFITGSGRGGQKINKSATCVFLKYPPSNTIIKCQHTRSREDNRYFARRRLCEKQDEAQQQCVTHAQQQHAKIRRQKKRRSRRSKQRMLDDKHRTAQIKKSRKKPSSSDEQ